MIVSSDNVAIGHLGAEYLCSLLESVAQDPAGIGAMGLELLVDAVENPGNYTPAAAPEKTPVDAVLVKE